MPAPLKTVTLGCKVNQYETEFVREALAGIGYCDAAPDEPADLCLVNTCTVTAEGDAKSRQAIRRLARENPAARIVVMGCYATRAPDEVGALPGVAEVITDKRELPDWLGRFGVADVPEGISRFAGHSRAFVKVQDGCLLRCSYCIIPHVRPQWEFGDLLVPIGIPLHDGMIDLFRLVVLELDVERTMRLGCPREDHHAAGGLVQPVDDEDLPELFLKHFDQIRCILLPAIRQDGNPGRFVKDEDVFIHK